MISTARFTSRPLAAARFVAQRGILRGVVWRTTRVSVHGTERLNDLKAPFIVVANHSSHLDAPLVMGALPRRHARYLAAGAAADYFFDVRWRTWLTALFFNAFPVERGASRQRAGAARSLLDAGVPILIFPEGGRSRDGVIGKFKAGAAALSSAADVPVVPIALVDAHKAMPRGVNWPVKGRPRVSVVIGSPMRATAGETPEHFSQRLADTVRELRASVTPDPAERGNR